MFKQSITGVSGAVTLKWLSQEEEVQSQCLNLKDGVFLWLEIASGPVEWTEKKTYRSSDKTRNDSSQNMGQRKMEKI